jgi:xanthine permease XanP
LNLSTRLTERVRGPLLRARAAARPSIIKEAKRKRPATLVYDVDEAPPLPLRITLAVQHVLAMAVGWIYVVVGVSSMGGSPAQTESLIRMSMIASGVATILQASRGSLGSGYFCPASCSLTYLAPTILAGRIGGLPLLFGMTTFSGLFTGVLSRFIRRLRALFPPDVTGLIVAVVGIQLVALGVPRFLGYVGPGTRPVPHSMWVGLITLAAMIMPTIWGRGRLRMYPILLGLCAGFASSLALGVLTGTQLRAELSGSWIGFPHRASSGMTFSFPLIVPFLIIGLAATLKTVGDLTLCQKMNDSDWKRTELRSVSGGVLANSIGSVLSGILGGVPQNTASSSLGLSLATSVTSRALALPAGILVIALAFFPKLAAVFSATPVPVMGAILVYSACFLVLGGLQVMTSRMLDARRILAVGIALVFGLSVEMAPDLYRDVPQLLHPMFTSSTAVSTILVVFLSVIFRIGVTKERTLELTQGDENLGKISEFMEEQGAAWGMRREVVNRAMDALYEVVTNGGLCLFQPKILVRTEFDEYGLEAEIEYEGEPVQLAESLPSLEEMASGAAIASIAGYMVRQYADRVKIKQRGSTCTIRLHFDQ